MEKNSSSQGMVESEKERENEAKEVEDEEEEEEEEYVLLDLDSVSTQISIPPNAPYVLSGLDTVNPILTIDNKIKLVRRRQCELYVLLGPESKLENMKKQLGHALYLGKVSLLGTSQLDLSYVLSEYRKRHYQNPMLVTFTDGDPTVREEAGPSGAKQTPAKHINPMAQLNKVLKFRILLEASEDEAKNQTDKPS